jgi:hypothetical protein
MNAISQSGNSVSTTGELKQWHKVTLTFEGPESAESSPANPFLDYRMYVTFIKGKAYGWRSLRF